MATISAPHEVILHVWANHLFSMYTYEPFFSTKKALVDPLPHQVDAVAAIVNMNPIRVLIADEVGLGKTIIAGMIIAELLERRRISRVLIVVPKAIVHQWIRELRERFGLEFVEITRENLSNLSRFAIISMDLAKKDDVLEVLLNTKWDLLVIDEAHRLTVHPKGERIEYTQRYKMAEKLAQVIPNVVLLTATPHSGIRIDFAYRLRLLDPSICNWLEEVTDECLHFAAQRLMIRRTKEEVRSIDNKPLFPRRDVIRIPVYLTDKEKEFYDAVTRYVRTYYAKAGKNSAVQLALIVLQRRVSSSIEAGVKSLEKRLNKLREIVTKHLGIPEARLELVNEYLEAWEELDEKKVEEIEEELSSLTAAKTLSELKEEIEELEGLLELGKSLLSKPDSKLQKVLDIVRREVNNDNKVIIFTEFKNTLDYLVRVLTKEGFVAASIHGGMSFEERRNQEEILRKAANVMVATDAAGEGLNLQVANVVINYEIPWNPNRIEQRMGRVHRYGQRKPVRVYNIILANTIEGNILNKLFEKIEDIRRFLGDKVFDLIGSILSESDIKSLIVEGEPLDYIFRTIDDRAYRLIEEYKLLIGRRLKPKDVPKDIPPPLIEFLTAWTIANGGKVYTLDSAMQIDVLGRTYIINTANPWSHEFVRELVFSYRRRPPVIGIFADVNGKNGTIYVYRLRVEGVNGTLWEGLRAYYVNADGNIERIPVNYIYYNLRSVEGTPLNIEPSENARAKTEALKDSYTKAEELRSEEEEVVAIIENEIRMRYTHEIEILKHQGTRITHEMIQKLTEDLNKEIEDLRKRIEAVRACDPELVAVIHLIPARRDADEEAKREVELAGMRAVMEYERRHGRKPEDVSKYNLGYDIESYDPMTGETRYIEVKSFRTSGDPELTEHEYEVAKILSSKYWLYIVENALDNPHIIPIRDPVHTATIVRVSRESYRIVKIVENRYIVKIKD